MANYTRFQLRGDTKANWLSVNPILAKNEPAIETDTNRFKIGDGVSTYSQLSYGRNTVEYSSLYNVTSLFPLPSGYYSHESAVLAIPVGERIKGLIITYETASGVWYTERFIGTNVSGWTTLSNWEKVPDASDVAQLRSDLSKVYKNYYITEIGSINGKDGSDVTVTFRVRTNYIPSPCKIEVDSQYYIRAALLYDGVKGTFVKALMDANSDKSICSYYAKDSGYVRFVISKNDDSSIQEDYLEPISSIDTLDILRLNQEIYKIQYSNIEYSLGGIDGDNGNFTNMDTRLRSSLIRTPALVKVDTKYRAVNCIEYSYNNDRLVFVEQIPIYKSPFDYNIIRIDKIALCRLTFKKDGNAVFDENEKPIIGYYNEVGTYQFKNDVELISFSMNLNNAHSNRGNFIEFSSNRRVLNFVKADCNIILNDGYTIRNVTLYDYNFNVVKELFGYTNTFFDYKKGQFSNDEYVRVTIAKDDNTNFTDEDNLIKYISSNGIVLSYNINMKSVSINGDTGEEVTNTIRKTTDIINTLPCILSVNDDFFVKGIQLYKNETWIAQNYFGSDVTLKSVRMTESSEYDGVRIVIAKNDESAFTDSDVNIIRNLLYLNDASEEVYNNL